jgi:uncharacterized membrane protein YebE (DUF533 family)
MPLVSTRRAKMDFFPPVNLNPMQSEAIARGLYALAKSDGVHEREAALVASFFDEVGGGAQAMAELERRAPITPEELAALLPEDEQRRLFIKTAILLVWADGEVTPQEGQLLQDYARVFHLDPKVLEQLDTEVKEYLLSQLAHVQNTEATRLVAQKLKL